MNFFSKWKKKDPPKEEITEMSFVKEIKEEFKPIDPVEARINEALDKLISKIHEKHFSPEIQKAFKEMDGPLGKIVYIENKRNWGYTETLATVSLNNIQTNYYYNIYDYKSNETIRKELVSIIRIYEYDLSNKPLKVIEKPLIECIYDYFFDGRLEKDIEKQTKSNREYEARKEKEKLEAADRLCKLIKDQKP